MNTAEARRYAHRLVATAMGLTAFDELSALTQESPDWPLVSAALLQIREQHARFGPKTTDRAPRPAPDKALPLLDCADLGVYRPVE